MEEKIRVLTFENQSLKVREQEFNVQIETLKDDHSKLKSEVQTQLEDKIKALVAENNSLKVQGEELKSRVDPTDLQAEIAGLKAQHESELSKASSDASTLQGALGTLHDSRVETSGTGGPFWCKAMAGFGWR